MLVVIVVILRLDVAVPMDDSTDARRFLGLGGKALSVILSLSRDEQVGTVDAGGGEAEGEESLSRSDYLNQ